MTTWIYAFREPSGFLKVGHTKEPHKRIDHLRRTYGGGEYEMQWAFPVRNQARRFEKECHEAFPVANLPAHFEGLNGGAEFVSASIDQLDRYFKGKLISLSNTSDEEP